MTFRQGVDTNPFLSTAPPLCVEWFLLLCSDTSHQLLRASLWANLVNTNTGPPLFVLSTVPKPVLHHSECPSENKESDTAISRTVCQLVRCAACAPTPFLSVSLTRPVCPSISGVVTPSVWLRFYSVSVRGCVLATTPQRWQLFFQGVPRLFSWQGLLC